VADGGDDQCQLLQSGVGVVSQHETGKAHVGKAHIENAHMRTKAMPGVVLPAISSAASSKQKTAEVAKKANSSDPWDILKGITDIIGSGANLTASLDHAKEEIPKLVKQLREIAAKMTSDVQSAARSEDVEQIVEVAYALLHDDTKKIADLLLQVPQTFLDGVGKMMPEEVRADLQDSLTEVATEVQAYAQTFQTAGQQIRELSSNKTKMCDAVGAGIISIKDQADKMVESAKALLPEDFDQKLKDGLEKLPDGVKKEVDKLIQKAKAVGEALQEMTEPAQEVAHSVHEAFAKYCPGLKGAAGRLQFSLLAAAVVVLGVSM
jgi:ABC-type transporter Mla subunit MlaD